MENSTPRLKSEIKQQIWNAKNQYIKNTQGYRTPDTLIIHMSDWFKLKEELEIYEIISPDGKLVKFCGMEVIRTEDIEEGVFIVK
jgi:hypothetical protein